MSGGALVKEVHILYSYIFLRETNHLQYFASKTNEFNTFKINVICSLSHYLFIYFLPARVGTPINFNDMVKCDHTF